MTTVGLKHDLPEDVRQEALNTAKQLLESRDEFNIVKNLEKDPITVPGQSFVIVSWCGPTFKAKTESYGFRIMGAFATIDHAKSYIQELHAQDSRFDTGVMEMNLWCTNYPRAFSSMDEYDQFLNDFIVKHKMNLEEEIQLFEARKRLLQSNTLTKEDEMPEELKDVSLKGAPTEEMKQVHQQWAGVTENNSEVKQSSGISLDLTSSSHKIDDQEYAAISFISTTGNNACVPMKIKGIYPTWEKCQAAIQQMMKFDKTFDILPVPLYKWLQCDPDLSDVKQIHTNEKLNEIIETEMKEPTEAMQLHEAVKSGKIDVLQNPINIIEECEKNIDTFSFRK